MRVCSLIFSLCFVAACEIARVPEEPLPSVVKCKPTWETRTLNAWLKRECNARDANDCEPMGRTTMLVEFAHDGCRAFKQTIENQAALIQGYAPEHMFVLVSASHDALTRTLFDRGSYGGAPCRVFLYDDTKKADRKMPNEDQWFVELCKDTTLTTENECQSQLSDKRLYTP